jgi:prolipoprotein diacylglyceryltransferase
MEILGLIPLAVLFFVVAKREKKLVATGRLPRPAGEGGGEGWFTGLLFVYYGALRFILDFWRARDIVGADVRYLGLTPAQFFAIVLVLIGAYWLVKVRKK